MRKITCDRCGDKFLASEYCECEEYSNEELKELLADKEQALVDDYMDSLQYHDDFDIDDMQTRWERSRGF